MQHLIMVRAGPGGQYTAEAVGIPDARATAMTREEATQQVQKLLAEWLASGQLVKVEVPEENPLLKWAGHCKDDPDWDVYLEEIQRFRREADERERGDSASTTSEPEEQLGVGS